MNHGQFRVTVKTFLQQKGTQLRFIPHHYDGVDVFSQYQFDGSDNFGWSEVTAHGVNRNPGLNGRRTDRFGGDGGKTAGTGLNFDVQNLTAAINASLGVDPMWTEGAANGVFSELRSDKCICGATVGAAALGLFTFRIGHKEGEVEQTAR